MISPGRRARTPSGEATADTHAILKIAIALLWPSQRPLIERRGLVR